MRKLFFITFSILLYFHSLSQDITGTWKGNIEISGQQLPIIFHFKKDSLGNIDGKWDSPLQKAVNLPFSSINTDRDSLRLSIKMIGGSYAGRFIDNDSIAGMWSQSGKQFNLNFARSSGEFSIEPKTSLRPGEKEIAITSYDGNKLYGNLLAKNDQQKLAIIIAGSGPTDRDGNNPLGNKADSYKLLAYALDSQNIATFRYDKRGIGESIPPDFNQANVVFDDYVKDAEMIFSYLHDSLGFKNIYFIGHSEGSLIGMIASQKKAVKGYVSIAGPGRPIDAVIEEQENASSLHDSMKRKVTSIFNELKKGNTTDDVPAELNSLFNKSIQPYFISWLKYDPAKEIKRLRCPVLILQGSCDKQVKVKDAEILHKASPKSKIGIIPLMTHALKNANADCVDENYKTYLDPSLPINQKLVEDISDFIKK
jgi:pimeloyl-ACP methyl ester carboxylesterase